MKNRSKFLSAPIERFIPGKSYKISSMLSSLEKTGGQPRRLGRAFLLWRQMLSQKRTIFCAIAGAPVPFGFGPTIATLIKERLIDVLAITGSQIGHDIVEILGGSHYQGTTDPCDPTLIDAEVNRYWDTYGDERHFKLPDAIYKKLIPTIKKPVTSREFIYLLGKALIPHAKKEGIITTAAKANFPIYCPGIADSVVGTDMGEVRFKYKDKIMFDVVKDNLEAAAIAAATEEFGGRTAAIIFGGGWPRNWIQQSQACSYMLDRQEKAKGHTEAIRFSYDPAETGALSGSTISEGISWRKYAKNVKSVECFLDANLSLAALTVGLLETKQKNRWFLNFKNKEDGSLAISNETKKIDLEEYFHFS